MGTVFDAIATDIPYGRSASTHGSDPGELFRQLLSLPEHHQFAVLARFSERASASLTREIWLLRKAARWRT